jgi:hypothetical protein
MAGAIPTTASNQAMACAMQRDLGMDEGLWQESRESHGAYKGRFFLSPLPEAGFLG